MLVALVLEPGELALLGRCQETAVADLADVQLEWVVGTRTGESRVLSGCRLVRGRGCLLVRRVEEMFGRIAFHGASIGVGVAPLEGLQSRRGIWVGKENAE